MNVHTPQPDGYWTPKVDYGDWQGYDPTWQPTYSEQWPPTDINYSVWQEQAPQAHITNVKQPKGLNKLRYALVELLCRVGDALYGLANKVEPKSKIKGTVEVK